MDSEQNKEWDSFTHEEKNKVLYERQRALLDEFLEHGAISKAQHDKSLHDLTEKMEIFDVVDETGQPTGEVISREEAHQQGVLHRTAHVWLVKKKPGGFDILMQKRSEEKDSFPGMYDTSSAGHIPAGDEPLESALRELSEELGLKARPEDMVYAGTFRIQYEKEFHGRLFRDNEVTRVYVCDKPVSVQDLTLQETEVSEVRWFDLEEVWEEIQHNRDRFCVPTAGLKVLREYLKGSGLK